MIDEQIADTIQEVSEALKSLPDGSLQQELMFDVHRSLMLAHSLIHAVNLVQLNRLLNGDS